jgi:hypothetical protein
MQPAHAQVSVTQPDTAVAKAESSSLWMASVSGGISARDHGPTGSFQIAALTRQSGRTYLRAALTRYQSTFSQSDTALPSTYVIGSIGAGGTFDKWTIDGYLSAGYQDYGLVPSISGPRPTTAGSGSAYYAAGLSVGRIIAVGAGWYFTPTLAVQYTESKLLRPTINDAVVKDFETNEPSWTGIAGVRLDHAFGAGQRHFVGVSLSEHQTSNGYSRLRRPALDFIDFSPESEHVPDRWQELAGSATISLGKNTWLDTVVSRSFGAVTGDSVAISAGVRIRF